MDNLTADRFWRKVSKDSSGGCWEWSGARDYDGYGIFQIKSKKSVRSHRLSWEFSVGEIPKGKWILHRCDNPPCVNPDHLFLGDVRDNVNDMVSKGRHPGNTYTGCPERRARGDRSGKRIHPEKLNMQKAKEIRELIICGATQTSVAKQFGISMAMVYKIIRGLAWV